MACSVALAAAATPATKAVPTPRSAADRSGFVINPTDASLFGGTVSTGAGDVNGDGLADLIVGAGNETVGPAQASTPSASLVPAPPSISPPSPTRAAARSAAPPASNRSNA
jgi:hypothetical protein